MGDGRLQSGDMTQSIINQPNEGIQMSEDKPVQWGNYRGCYLGLAEAAKTGPKQDGSTWTKNKLNFTHIGIDGQPKMIKFGTFLPIDKLVLNGYYHIVFRTDEFNLPDGTPAKSKTATAINPSTKDENQGFEQKVVPATPGQQVQEDKIPSLAPVKLDPIVFANAYRDSPKNISEKTLPDFVGNFIKATDNSMYVRLKAIYDEVVHLKPKIELD